MTKLPQFANEQEEAAFWDDHDSTEFLDETEPVNVTFIDARKPIHESLTTNKRSGGIKRMTRIFDHESKDSANF